MRQFCRYLERLEKKHQPITWLLNIKLLKVFLLKIILELNTQTQFVDRLCVISSTDSNMLVILTVRVRKNDKSKIICTNFQIKGKTHSRFEKTVYLLPNSNSL